MISIRAAFLGHLFLTSCATRSEHARLHVGFDGDAPRVRAVSVVDGSVLPAATDEPHDLVLDANRYEGRCFLRGQRRNVVVVGDGDAAAFAELANGLLPWRLAAIEMASKAAGVRLDEEFTAYWPTIDAEVLPGRIFAVRERAASEGIAALLAVVAVGARGEVEFAIATAPPAPSGVFLKVYAMQFVAALRAGGASPGAFAIDDEPGDDAIWRLRVDLLGSDAGSSAAQELTVGLAASRAGLAPVEARIDGREASFAATPWLQRAHRSALAAAQRETR